MKKTLSAFTIFAIILGFGCSSPKPKSNDDADKSFATFEDNFLDAYWKQHPAGSIFAGYGKYYDELVIPNGESFAKTVAFSQLWIDSLTKLILAD